MKGSSEKIDVEDLVLKAKEEDTEAVKEILKKYRRLIMKEAARYRIPSYDYEDIVQHGYLTVIKSIKMYKVGSSSFNGYVINAIRNNFNALLKGQIKNYREVPDNSLLDIDSQRYDFTIEDEIIAFDEVEKLYRAIDALDEEERAIITGFYINQKSLNEVACDGNIDYYKAFRVKKKALYKLRQAIEKEEKVFLKEK